MRNQKKCETEIIISDIYCFMLRKKQKWQKSNHSQSGSMDNNGLKSVFGVKNVAIMIEYNYTLGRQSRL